MGRRPRKLSKSGFYHIIFRGINRQHLFEDDSDYLYIPVEADEYFIPLICYIHQNPIRAGLVRNLAEYRFSSYLDYVRGGTLSTTNFSINLFGKSEWMRMHSLIINGNLDATGKCSLTEEEVRRRILEYTDGKDPHEVSSWCKAERNALLRQLKEKAGLSIRHIERVTGISRGIVAKS